MPQSPNKATITSLLQTLQNKTWIEKNEPSKLYDALVKMNDDLNKAYNALFFGPLPPVDGNALFNLNALNITGIIPEDNLPANIAFQDRFNLFNELNSFINEEEASIAIGFGTIDADREYLDEPSSWLRFGSEADGEFFISQNFNWNGTDFDRDDDLISGSIIKFVDGDINLSKWLPADAIDYPDPYLAECWFFKGKEFGIRNYAQDDDLIFALIDSTDVILLGESAGSFVDDYRGYVAIPNKIDTALPISGQNEANGIIAIDKTNADLVYYTNGLRYRLNGVAF